MCGPAALVHALACVSGKAVASMYQKKMKALRSSTSSLGDMGVLMQQMRNHVPKHLYARVQLQKLKGARLQEFSKSPYMWLNKQSGTFVVHFWVTGKVDHAVCVDGRRNLIWDNEEMNPVDLTSDSLRLCVGSRSKKVEVRAMEMVKQREKTDQKKTVEVIHLD